MSSTRSGSLSAFARMIRSYSPTVIRRSPAGANGVGFVIGIVDVVEDIVTASTRLLRPQPGRAGAPAVKRLRACSIADLVSNIPEGLRLVATEDKTGWRLINPGRPAAPVSASVSTGGSGARPTVRKSG